MDAARDGDTVRDAPAVGSVPETDGDADGDADGECDGSDAPVADAAALDVALSVTRAEGDASKDTRGDRLVPPLSDTRGLSDAATVSDAVGEHDATGSTNGMPTAEPAFTAHAPVPVLCDPTPSNITVPRASNTWNETAGMAPRPLPHAHPLVSLELLPGDSEQAMNFAPAETWSHSTGRPEGADTAFVIVSQSEVRAGRPMMPATSTVTTR